MNIGGGEAADQLVRMLLSGGEVAVRLGGSAAKNLLAMSLALAKNHKKISGKVRMGKMLQQTRDLRVFPMTQEEYREFRHKAREPKLLYAAIQNSRDPNDPEQHGRCCHAGHRGGTGQLGVPEDDVPAAGGPPEGAAGTGAATGEGTWNAKKRFPVGTRLARYQHQLSYARRERGEDDE